MGKNEKVPNKVSGKFRSLNLWSWMCCLIFTMSCTEALALSLLMTSDQYWFDQNDKTIVSANLDIKGLKRSEILAALRGFEGSLGSKRNGLNISIESSSDGEAFVRISLPNALHSDLKQLLAFAEKVEKKGATGLSPELPFAPRILHVESNKRLLKFAQQMSGLRMRDVNKIITKEKENLTSGKPVIFRYYLEDIYQQFTRTEAKVLRDSFGPNDVRGFLPTGLVGRMPVMIDGESAMFHSRDYHAGSIVARYNPSLVNRYIQEFVQRNKFAEYIFFESFAPGAMPRTVLLESFIKPMQNDKALTHADITQLWSSLNLEFPQGWVLKGTNESNTALLIITEKTDIFEKLKSYDPVEFAEYERKIRRTYAGADEDTIFEHLQENKGYFGWKFSRYLQNPHTAVVQAKLNLDREYRTDVFMGKVIPLTIDRHIELRQEQGENLKPSTPKQFAAAEAWVRETIDQMARTAAFTRWTHGGWDYARQKDGSFGLIESNMGTESSGFYDTAEQIRFVNDLLEKYPALIRTGVLGQGLSARAQMEFIRRFAAEHKLDLKKLFPGHRISETSLTQKYEPIQVRPEYLVKSSASVLPFERSEIRKTSTPEVCRQAFGS